MRFPLSIFISYFFFHWLSNSQLYLISLCLCYLEPLHSPQRWVVQYQQGQVIQYQCKCHKHSGVLKNLEKWAIKACGRLCSSKKGLMTREQWRKEKPENHSSFSFSSLSLRLEHQFILNKQLSCGTVDIKLSVPNTVRTLSWDQSKSCMCSNWWAFSPVLKSSISNWSRRDLMGRLAG